MVEKAMQRGWRAVGVRAVFLLGCLTLGACGGGDDDRPSTKPTDQYGFGACPGSLPGSNQGRACAVTQVPLRWDEPDGKKIDVLVARYLSVTPHRGQIWLLDGGPGGTGAIYMQKEILALYASLGLDVYVPQHRGTGHSTPLTCKSEELSECGAELVAKWGDGLRGFHSTEAAHDVGSLIDRFRTEGERIFVFGLSYGSYWAQRYLQAFPSQADGVILEGVFPLGEDLWEGDVIADAAGRSVFEACRAEPDCAAAFGDEDPEDVARRVLSDAKLPERRCMGADGPLREQIEGVLSLLVVSDLGHVAPGLFRRLDRCSDADQKELLALAEFISEVVSSLADPELDNGILGVHVLRTDLMAKLATFPLDDMLAARDPLVFWSGAASSEDFDAIVEGWPVNYAPAPTELEGLATPLLLMNGGLDIQTPTPWARKLAQKLAAPLIEFPYVGHGVDVSLASPLTAGDASCSLGILRSFVDDPTGAIDGSCAKTAYTPDVAGHGRVTRSVTEVLYGHETPLLGSEPGEPNAKRVRSERVTDLEPVARLLRERLTNALRDRRARQR
jgi:pimeloyl-ACP methyl ester carboxylesterase